MISLFLSKNSTRTTTLDELIDVIHNHKDLLEKNGSTMINGIRFYHFKNGDDEAVLSYGSNSLKIYKNWPTSTDKVYVVKTNVCSSDKELLRIQISKDKIDIGNGKSSSMEIPESAFDSEIDFFQYTLVGLKYSCTDASLIKLVKLLKGITNDKF